MRRLARGSTILSAHELLLTQRAGAARPLRAHGRTTFATRQICAALAYDYMAHAHSPDLAGLARPAQGAPGQQSRVRW